MTDECIASFVRQIFDKRPEPRGFLLDYPKGQDQWSDAKKLKYEKNLMRVFYDK